MYKNKTYWDEFYKKNYFVQKNSRFSEIINKRDYDCRKYLILELGCGSGEDSIYFSNQGFEVIAVDGSESIISLNKYKNNNSIEFLCIDLSEKKNVEKLLKKVDAQAKSSNKELLIYNRFFLHSIPENVEDLLINSFKENLSIDYCIISEFRTIEDQVLYKIFDNHYRRYVDANQLLQKLITNGFDIVYSEKGRGMSVYKDENPFLARIIVKGKSNNGV